MQNEGGFGGETGFEWEKPASDGEIKGFEETNGIMLPQIFKDFIKISNGAVLFKDIKYGQWGCKILGLNELMDMAMHVKKMGYQLKPEWIVFATWLGDGDILIFDLKKSSSGDKNYIVDGEQGEKINNWPTINGDFAKWLDRLIVSQGQSIGDGVRGQKSDVRKTKSKRLSV